MGDHVKPFGDDGHVVEAIVREDGHRWLVQCQVVRYEDGHLLEEVLYLCHRFREYFTGDVHLDGFLLLLISACANKENSGDSKIYNLTEADYGR